LMHTDNAYSIGKKMCEKLKKLIPRTIWYSVQAAIGVKLYLVKREAAHEKRTRHRT
jgi:translation elongation factor EF-4